MANAVFPIPPIPCRACTTTLECLPSRAARNAVSSSTRPVNTRLRACTSHTRPASASPDPARGKSRNPAHSASLSSSGVLTVSVHSPHSLSRARNVSCRAA